MNVFQVLGLYVICH